ncbi:unnamed protein product [Didymodactylos carnosus]|nr:unnamed protein product [Didymodactylos carnosus]CAF4383232.1 unnamed protein product [Didymodactylos carnosus]
MEKSRHHNCFCDFCFPRSGVKSAVDYENDSNNLRFLELGQSLIDRPHGIGVLPPYGIWLSEKPKFTACEQHWIRREHGSYPPKDFKMKTNDDITEQANREELINTR